MCYVIVWCPVLDQPALQEVGRGWQTRTQSLPWPSGWPRAWSLQRPLPGPAQPHLLSPQVGNLGLLFMLLFFIYAALGVELFGKLGA